MPAVAQRLSFLACFLLSAHDRMEWEWANAYVLLKKQRKVKAFFVPMFAFGACHWWYHEKVQQPGSRLGGAGYTYSHKLCL